MFLRVHMIILLGKDPASDVQFSLGYSAFFTSQFDKKIQLLSTSSLSTLKSLIKDMNSSYELAYRIENPCKKIYDGQSLSTILLKYFYFNNLILSLDNFYHILSKSRQKCSKKILLKTSSQDCIILLAKNCKKFIPSDHTTSRARIYSRLLDTSYHRKTKLDKR